MKMKCSCGFEMTRQNSKFIGFIDGVDKDFDLELYDCPQCHSSRAHRIYREDGIIEIERELTRKGFHEEARSAGDLLREERKNSYIGFKRR